MTGRGGEGLVFTLRDPRRETLRGTWNATELTGDWEYKLARMERGQMSRDAFMKEIAAMTQLIVDRAKTYDSDTIPGDFGELTGRRALNAAERIKETYKKFQCQACEFSLWEDRGRKAVRGGRNRGRCFCETQRRPADRFPQQDGPAVQRNDPSQRRGERRPSSISGRAASGEVRDAVEAGRFHRPKRPLGRLPEMRRHAYSSTGWPIFASTSVGPEKTLRLPFGERSFSSRTVDEAQMQQIARRPGAPTLLKEFVSSTHPAQVFGVPRARQPTARSSFEFEKREPKAPKAKTAKPDKVEKTDKAEKPT